MHTVILLAFIDVFCMNVDLIMLHLGISCTGPMTLPTDVKWQCHHNVGQCRQVNSKVFPHTILYQINLIF